MTDRDKRVEAALRAGKTTEAARISLENPPFGSKNIAIKDKNTAIVMKAVVALGQKDADVASFLESLDADLADNLMKVRQWRFLKPHTLLIVCMP
jgi:thioesterase domain-containing protein